jgi:hypothetical protein
MGVRVTMDRRLRLGIPQPLFNIVARAGQYEPARDGERFLVNAGSGTAALPITISTNWLSGLNR